MPGSGKDNAQVVGMSLNIKKSVDTPSRPPPLPYLEELVRLAEIGPIVRQHLVRTLKNKKFKKKSGVKFELT